MSAFPYCDELIGLLPEDGPFLTLTANAAIEAELARLLAGRWGMDEIAARVTEHPGATAGFVVERLRSFRPKQTGRRQGGAVLPACVFEPGDDPNYCAVCDFPLLAARHKTTGGSEPSHGGTVTGVDPRRTTQPPSPGKARREGEERAVAAGKSVLHDDFLRAVEIIHDAAKRLPSLSANDVLTAMDEAKVRGSVRGGAWTRAGKLGYIRSIGHVDSVNGATKAHEVKQYESLIYTGLAASA